jgi:hypothetical protein
MALDIFLKLDTLRAPEGVATTKSMARLLSDYQL